MGGLLALAALFVVFFTVCLAVGLATFFTAAGCHDGNRRSRAGRLRGAGDMIDR
jgi:hypothetical protein